MSEDRFEGSVAVVTGAGRGIGEAIAVALAARGSAVVLGARSRSDASPPDDGTIDAVARRISDAGGRVLAVTCDVASDTDCQRLVAAARDTFGPVGMLVNNAAAFGTGSLMTMTASRYRLCFEVNVFAAYRLMQLVLPDMVAAGRGSVLNITSDASRRPPEGLNPSGGPGAHAYGASKLALEHLTRSAAYEVGGHGVAVNALMPSLPVPTPAMLALTPELDESVSAESFADAALKVLGARPEQWSGAVLYSEDVLYPELGVRGWLTDRL